MNVNEKQCKLEFLYCSCLASTTDASGAEHCSNGLYAVGITSTGLHFYVAPFG